MIKKILIIKHGALGDLIQTTSSLKSIRLKYPKTQITLLTDTKFKYFTANIPFVDQFIYEKRPSFLRLDLWSNIILKLVLKKFDLVFDLQNSDRTSIYHFFMKLFKPKILWSGNRRGGIYKYQPDNFEQIPIKDRIINQLRLIDVIVENKPDLDWMIKDNIKHLPIGKFVILLPGSSIEHKYKRWPAEKFAEISNYLKEKTINSVILGQMISEGDEINKIKLLSPTAIDCSDKDLSFLASLADKASGAIGNDSGPAFIAAAVGCPITWLLSSHTNPNITQLVGSMVNILKKNNIAEITTEEVKNNLALRD